MDSKQRVHSRNADKHLAVLADKAAIMQQIEGERKYVLEKRILRSKQIQMRAEHYIKLLICGWQSVCKYTLHS